MAKNLTGSENSPWQIWHYLIFLHQIRFEKKKDYDCIYIEFTAELQYAKGKSALQLITV